MNFFIFFLFISVFIAFFVYIYFKLSRRGYFFSIFNIGVYIYFFSIVISPIFFYYDEAWTVFGIHSAGSMLNYLNDSLLINLVGFFFFIIFLLLLEFYSNCPVSFINYSYKYNKYISDLSIKIFFIIFVLIFIYICLFICEGFPLLNQNRTFFLNTSVSPIYLFINQGILLFTLYYGINYILHKKNLFLCLLGGGCLILQGNRGSFLLGILFPLLVVFMYYKNGDNKNDNQTNKLKLRSKRVTRKIFILIPFFILLGFLLQFLRKGANDVSIIMLIHELLFGNTFSDIRDGAFILMGFDKHYDCFLIGKTYFSAIISFIPSSLSDFRYTWSWGRFTSGLFNFQNHFGLRGGNSLEGYLNFSWFAVIIVSFCQAVIISKLELVFYNVFILKKVRFVGKEIFIYCLLLKVYSCLSSSSATYDIYSILVILFLLRLMTKCLRISVKRV